MSNKLDEKTTKTVETTVADKEATQESSEDLDLGNGSEDAADGEIPKYFIPT
jgi:hypothetical protein